MEEMDHSYEKNMNQKEEIQQHFKQRENQMENPHKIHEEIELKNDDHRKNEFDKIQNF